MTNASDAKTPARALLDTISPHRRQAVEQNNEQFLPRGVPFRLPTDSEAEEAITQFVSQIEKLEGQHNHGKSITDDRLAEQVFRKAPSFASRQQFLPYGRYQLRVAVAELKSLIDSIRQAGNGKITYEGVWRYSDFLTDYLFDLREILVQLQSNVDGWQFFDGHKVSGVTSWEIYGLANGLAWQSTFAKPGKSLNHKAGQIASIGVLRQALEKRFERLIAVYPIDPNENSPRLRHGYHQEFIAAHPELFQADAFDVAKLQGVYDWCSEIVHQAYQPYIWLITYALRRSGELLQSRAVAPGERWSIYNAVKVPDVDTMQTSFENHFLDTYGHGEWKFFRDRPEALVDGWRDDMRGLSDDFVPVRNPHTRRCNQQDGE